MNTLIPDTSDSIIKNERASSINMLLQFTTARMRQMLSLCLCTRAAVLPRTPHWNDRSEYPPRARSITNYYVLHGPMVSSPAGNGLETAVAIRLVGTRGRHSPSPHWEQGAGWRRRPDSNR